MPRPLETLPPITKASLELCARSGEEISVLLSAFAAAAPASAEAFTSMRWNPAAPRPPRPPCACATEFRIEGRALPLPLAFGGLEGGGVLTVAVGAGVGALGAAGGAAE